MSHVLEIWSDDHGVWSDVPKGNHFSEHLRGPGVWVDGTREVQITRLHHPAN